jgi:hypothetical protein
MKTMKLTGWFRLTLHAYWISLIAGIAVWLATKDRVSQDWQDLLGWDGHGGVLGLVPTEPESLAGWAGLLTFLALLGILAVLEIYCVVGLFRYRRTARRLFAWLTVLWLALSPAFGLTVTLPWEEPFYALTWITSGAILALAYLSPLRRRFRRPAPAR